MPQLWQLTNGREHSGSITKGCSERKVMYQCIRCRMHVILNEVIMAHYVLLMCSIVLKIYFKKPNGRLLQSAKNVATGENIHQQVHGSLYWHFISLVRLKCMCIFFSCFREVNQSQIGKHISIKRLALYFKRPWKPIFSTSFLLWARWSYINTDTIFCQCYNCALFFSQERFLYLCFFVCQLGKKNVMSRTSMHQSGFSKVGIKMRWQLWDCLLM